jgi:polysaccharide export outer membrane protein
MSKYLVVCGAMLLALGGCASRPALRASPDYPDIQLLQAKELPAPAGLDLSNPARPYRIGPFDRLKVDVFGVQDLATQEIQADASGRISVPLAGEVEAAGHSPGEVAKIIEQRLRRYIRNPQVAVNLVETVSQVVTVDGAVHKPGLYPVLGEMTLMKAVARAEGLSEMAQESEVVVFRTVDGQKYAALYNLHAIRQGAYKDPEIFANDIVVVGQSARRQLFKDSLAVVPALLTPLIYLLR